MRLFGMLSWWLYPAFLLTAAEATLRFFGLMEASTNPRDHLSIAMLPAYLALAAGAILVVSAWRLPHGMKGPYQLVSLGVLVAWALTSYASH